MVDRKLVKILRNISVLLKIKGENPFKAEAYENAADVIESNQLDIAELVRTNSLGKIKGFGEALVKKITEYVQTGTFHYYEKLKEEIPEGLIAVTKIPGIGPKKAKVLYDKLSIQNLDDLEQACLDNKIANIKGFSPKSQEIILNGIQHVKAWKGKKHQFECFDEAKLIEERLKEIPSISRFSITGDIRRVVEIVSMISFIAESENPPVATKQIADIFNGNIENSTVSFQTNDGIPVTIEVTSPQNYIWRLHNTTANQKYLERFAEVVKAKTGQDFHLAKFPIENAKIQTEEDLFKWLGLQFIPSEIREDGFAIERAMHNNIPKLIEPKDMRGMLHIHSTWSDGRNTIEEMALRAKELNFEYIAVCDHSQTAKYANGLEIERVIAQHQEIDALNEKNLGIKILKGIESDILPDGSLDYPPEILETFDLVVASIHSGFKMTKNEMTRRIIYALRSPYTHILGHPTGRLLLSRESYEVDVYEIIDAASDYGKIIELNANPYRLDLSWEYLLYAKEKGVRIAINPDSHDTYSLEDVFYGLKFARKGWLEPNDVVNCLSYNKFIGLLKQIRGNT
jgi:DNA polymerase (family 10)